jgi:hypothetical protein
LHDNPANCSAEKLRPPFATVAREWRISGIGHLNDTYPGLNETFPGRGVDGSRWSIAAPGNAVNESRVLEVQQCFIHSCGLLLLERRKDRIDAKIIKTGSARH